MANGTSLSHQQHQSSTFDYDLWDGRFYYGCKCDPWYTGHDCSQRRCPVGVDPMYEAGGAERNTTFRVHVAWSAALDNDDTWFRIRVFDYWGDSFVTTKIKYHADDATLAGRIELALLALPNEVVEDVVCKATLHASDLAQGFPYYLDHGVAASDANHDNIYCMLKKIPGSLRLPVIADSYREVTSTPVTVWSSTQGIYILPTLMSGENLDYAAVTDYQNGADPKVTVQTPTITEYVTTQVTTTMIHSVTADTYKLVKIDSYYLVFHFTSTDKVQPVFKSPVTFTTPTFKMSAATVTKVTTTDAEIKAWEIGSYTFTNADVTHADVTGFYTVGAVLFIENVFYTVQELVDDSAGDYIRVDRPFAGKYNGDGSAEDVNIVDADDYNSVYKIEYSTSGTNEYEYVNECSNRGLCNRDSGLCECFPGFFTSNCDTQSHLAN
jgi:hypothetical protein